MLELINQQDSSEQIYKASRYISSPPYSNNKASTQSLALPSNPIHSLPQAQPQKSLLHSPHHNIHHHRDNRTQVNAHIPAITRKLGGNRTNIPRLRHTRQAARKVPRKQRDDGRESKRQRLRTVPDQEVVALGATEELVLEQEDDRKADGPVAEKRHEIGHDGREVLLAGDGEHRDDDGKQQRPDQARDRVEVVAEQLDGEAAGVVDGDVVAEHGEREDDERELGPARRMVHGADEAAEAVVRVRVREGGDRGGDGDVAEEGPHHDGEGHGDEHAEVGEHEDFPPGRADGVLHVVVAGDAAPAGGVGEGEGDHREIGTCAGHATVDAGGRGVHVWGDLPGENQQENEGCDPGVFFVGVDDGEAKDGDDVAYYGHDDDPDRDAHAVVGNSGEDLADYDEVHDEEAAAYDYVEHRTEFGAPETETIAGDGDLAEAELQNCALV